MKTYSGYRGPEGCVVKVHEADGTVRALSPRLDLRNHSPTGFEWSYADSGPAQLALALACGGADLGAVLPGRDRAYGDVIAHGPDE